MVTEIVQRAPEALELQSADTAALRAELATQIGITEAAIVRIAAIWRELERRGEDLSDIRFSLRRFLGPIAEGRLLPSLVVAMSGQLNALRRLADLPVREQARLAAGEPLEIYRGDRVERLTLMDLTYSDVAAVVRDGAIRSVTEQQMAWERAKRARPTSRPGRPPRIIVSDDMTVRIGKVEVPAERLIAALRAAKLI